jgi:hypothetical protein
MTFSLARLGMLMGSGPPDETGMAALMPQPATDPAIPLALTSATRRPVGGNTLIFDAGGEDVIVVLDTAGADARQIWDFIQRRRTGRKIGRM